MIQTSVVIKQFPKSETRGQCRRFLREFKAEFAEAYRPQLILDFSGVENITSHGIDLLLRCVMEIAERDGDLKLAGATDQTALVLELTQMSEVIESFDSVEEALASWDVLSAPVTIAKEQEPAESSQAA